MGIQKGVMQWHAEACVWYSRLVGNRVSYVACRGKVVARVNTSAMVQVGMLQEGLAICGITEQSQAGKASACCERKLNHAANRPCGSPKGFVRRCECYFSARRGLAARMLNRLLAGRKWRNSGRGRAQVQIAKYWERVNDRVDTPVNSQAKKSARSYSTLSTLDFFFGGCACCQPMKPSALAICYIVLEQYGSDSR